MSTKKFKKVTQLDLKGKRIKEYCSIAEASRQTGVCITSISHCCHGDIGGIGAVGGFIFKFKNK